jgi:glutamine amidotransferase
MLTIINYGLGNVQAFVELYKRNNVQARVAARPEELEGATRLILPGVGSFDHAMDMLGRSGLRAALDRLVLRERVPVLGICVGMQILAHGSDEGVGEGLGWIPGHVRLMSRGPQNNRLSLPHMGWNDIQPNPASRLFEGLEARPRYYFLHSYYFDAEDPAVIAATASYGIDFACAVAKENIFGVQFHPEKSHHWGAELLKNFAGADPCFVRG